MGLKITIIMHPRGTPARVEELRRAVSRLRGAGHRVLPRLTFEAGDAARLAHAAARARSDLVVAIGGDGTVNEVANGMVRGRWQPRLGIVPLGTANDFAAGLELPGDLDEALRIAIHGRAIGVDVGVVNRRAFLNVSTGGFGATTSGRTPREAKRLLGPLAYLVTGVKEFVDLEASRGCFRADGELLYSGDFLLFAVGNARRTGGGSLLTPRAELDDGLLDLLLVPALPRLDFLALLPELRAGAHLEQPSILYRRVRTLDVRTTRPLSVNADGEPLRARCFRYRVKGRPLSVMRK